MSKAKTVFFCNDCGNETPRWQGRCPACGAWSSLVEAPQEGKKEGKSKPSRSTLPGHAPIPISHIPSEQGRRISTRIGEFDRILGGGLMEGSVTLIGGEPGVGKSTLLLQVAQELASSTAGPILYITGEESASQTRMRAERMGTLAEALFVQCETNVEEIESTLVTMKPVAAVIDSIQTLSSSDIASAPGSVSQIRESAARLVRIAKDQGLALFFIGHVTKEGVVAGPRLLEHMVDTVLYFEGERHFSHRILRAVKNRFGSTNEIGIFEMTEKGLIPVENPSEIFLAQRPIDASGSIVLAALEGSRPLLVEVQALVSPAGAFGSPRRTAHGMDNKRLALILAILEKRAGIPLSTQDVFVNVAGGLYIDEPALDLAVALAVAGSARNTAVERGVAVFGELGLAGEIRSVGQVQKRLNESRRLGFTSCIYGAPLKEKPRREEGLSLLPASNIREALDMVGLHQ